jgi:rsbT co-antagonist protein RsbR
LLPGTTIIGIGAGRRVEGVMPGEVLSRELTEADYRLMVDSITDTEIVMLDHDGHILSWNEGAKALKGYAADEVLGKHVSIFYPPEDNAAGVVERELDQAASAGRFEGAGWRVRKGGERFWANVVIQPMRDPHGQIGGFVKVTRDLTEPRRREEELHLASLMLDSITDYEVILLAADGTIKTWNRGAERLKGYHASEVIGRHVSIFYPEEDIEAGLAERELSQALQAGRFEFEGWRTRKDGERFWANVVLSPVRDADGNHIGFVKVTRDLTERVAREQLLQRQRDDILELSTPVIQVWERVLALPIIGTLDSGRAARLTESLLERIAADEALVVILDISGVPTIDTAVAMHLFKTIKGARLMGAESIISGVRPETAQAMVHLGIEMGGVRSRSTLRDALQLAFGLLSARSPVEQTVNGAASAKATP